MTYSIVARDRESGELGVAVQTRVLGVGAVVPWVEAGVGAVATQSIARRAYGPAGLARMRAGASAGDALAALVAEDDERDVRQVAMVDASGRVAVHTGARCIASAGHVTGDGFSVQANMMRGDGVPAAMAAAYEAATGPLAERLLAALDAAEAAGGDIRGGQSAAIVVACAEPSADDDGVRYDLRVEDHPDPNVELRRLARLRSAGLALGRAEELSAQGRLDDAVGDARAALALAPDDVQLGFWWALELVKHGRDDDAWPLLDRAFAADPGWRELVPRLVAARLLDADAATIGRILGG
jgi:uncharacterized Ntn-hydrolase superfamily protein